jgi:hypothetical protein
MKTIVINALVAHIDQFNKKHPELSLSSLCILAKWNSSSHTRALRSRKLPYLEGGTYNPGRLIQEALEADQYDKAQELLEQFVAFRAEADYLLTLEDESLPEVEVAGGAVATVDGGPVDAELVATSPEIDSLPTLNYEADATDLVEGFETDLTDEIEEAFDGLEEDDEDDFDADLDEDSEEDLVAA